MNKKEKYYFLVRVFGETNSSVRYVSFCVYTYKLLFGRCKIITFSLHKHLMNKNVQSRDASFEFLFAFKDFVTLVYPNEEKRKSRIKEFSFVRISFGKRVSLGIKSWTVLSKLFWFLNKLGAIQPSVLGALCAAAADLEIGLSLLLCHLILLGKSRKWSYFVLHLKFNCVAIVYVFVFAALLNLF